MLTAKSCPRNLHWESPSRAKVKLRHRVELLREYQEGYPTRLLLLPKLTCRCSFNKDTWEIEVELDGEVSVLRVTTD